jgi:glucose-1-phosphate thymidylyltransferase
MKGIVLAGGMGTRLLPLTRVANKHLLPVYNRPMIWYPINTLARAGIREILVVTGGQAAPDFLRVLGYGKDFDLDTLHYIHQDDASGIAGALALAEDFVGGDSCCFILGDNILRESIASERYIFEHQRVGARILVKEVSDPERFGIAEVSGPKVISIEEKPQKPKSNLAVIGVYFYDDEVFNIARTLKPSNRGELEVTDINNWYVKKGLMSYGHIMGYWADAGTIESLAETSREVAHWRD